MRCYSQHSFLTQIILSFISHHLHSELFKYPNLTILISYPFKYVSIISIIYTKVIVQKKTLKDQQNLAMCTCPVHSGIILHKLQGYNDLFGSWFEKQSCFLSYNNCF
uniref:Uncharacterized protein n=1 Tax=Cacopsylla melanoneura TaxID=428564 RepID=A0A8D8SFK0_9HEMI